jgi:hypothetical protein
MASNKELTDQILVVAAELNKPVETNGLKNDELVTLLGQLNDEKAKTASQTPAATVVASDAAGSAELAAAQARANEAAAANKLRADAAKTEATGTAEWVVAKGISVSTLRGIVDEDKPVSARDFARGDLDIRDLASREPPVLVKKK